MESPENLGPLPQFKFDLRSFVARLSALKGLGRDVPPDDIEQHKAILNKLDEIFDDHKSAFDDGEKIEIEKLLSAAKSLLGQFGK